MSLWSMFRSPLMFGGDMTYNDEFTLSLMQNREIININQNSNSGRELYRKGKGIVWAANGADGEYYVAHFNTGEDEITDEIVLSYAGIAKAKRVKEIWSGEASEGECKSIKSTAAPHDVRLYKVEV